MKKKKIINVRAHISGHGIRLRDCPFSRALSCLRTVSHGVAVSHEFVFVFRTKLT